MRFPFIHLEEMKFNDQGVDSLVDGLTKVCEIILSTMGPFGNKVCIPDSTGTPTFSRDGVTVARALVSPFDATDGKDWKYMNMGARLVVDACDKTVKAGGDGTTTTAALLRGFVKGVLGAEGNVNEVVSSLKSAVNKVHEQIDQMSRKPSKEELLNLTTVSANNNVELGKMIADLVWELGEDAYIEPVPNMGETKTEIIKGYDLGSGFMIPQYKALNTETFGKNIAGSGNQIWLANPYVLLIEEQITQYQDLVPIYKAFKKTMVNAPGGKKEFPRALIIIAAEVSEDALQFVIGNLFPRKATDTPAPVFLLKSPEQGVARYESMKDVQIAVGSKNVFSKHQGRPLRLFEGEEDFGSCLRAEISMDNCRMILKEDTASAVDRRIAQIKDEVKNEGEANKRIGKLSKGIGLITIGGYTETEYNYLNQVIEDAVLAAISALKHGVVPGAGKALQLAVGNTEWPEDSIVKEILFKACLVPAITVLKNAKVDGNEIMEILSNPSLYNVVTGKFEGIEETKILDSAEVVKSAIAHSVSLASEIAQSKYGIII